MCTFYSNQCYQMDIFLSKLNFLKKQNLIERLKISFPYSFAGSHLHYLSYKPLQYLSLYSNRQSVWKSFRDSLTLERHSSLRANLVPSVCWVPQSRILFSFWYTGTPQTHPDNRGGSTGAIRMSGMGGPKERTCIWGSGEKEETGVPSPAPSPSLPRPPLTLSLSLPPALPHPQTISALQPLRKHPAAGTPVPT